MELILQRFTPGIGPEMPQFNPNSDWPLTGLNRSPHQGGFLADRDIGAPTSYDEAVTAMRSDEQAGAWLRDHPDAVPASVRHEDHLPSSPTGLAQPIDAWVVTWIDSSGASLAVRAQKQTYSTTLLPATIQVSESTPDLPPSFPVETLGPSLKRMLEVARNYYGDSQINFTCDLAGSSCSFDPERGGGGIQLGFGLVFWLEHGWVVQEASSERLVLDEPA
jgi:hypothetical protein